MLDHSIEFLRPQPGRVAMAESRENLTVLMVDVSDSTRLYESLGDEIAFREVRACLELFEKAVTANRGRVVRAVGDGLICVFDDAAAAVAAAIEMQSGLRDHMSERARRIAIRVGLHYGPVLSDGNDVFGDTVKIAGRMARFAASGQIITTGDTVAQLAPELQRLTRHLDAFAVAGRADNITVHEVLWQTTVDYTQVQGRFETVLAEAGIGRMWLTHDGREIAVVTSVTMGRHASNDLVLKDLMASRNHARIERRKDKFVLIDLSANGTFVALDGGGDRARLRREEMLMYGSGVISFGHAAGEDDAEEVRFRVE
jgi:class 3 adenylate cyclase